MQEPLNLGGERDFALNVQGVALAAGMTLFAPTPADRGPEGRFDVTVEPGDTMMTVLLGAGIDRVQAHRAIQALEPVFDPRRLQIGQTVTLTVERALHGARLAGLDLVPDVERRVVVQPTGTGFTATEQPRALETRHTAAEGTITTSLYHSFHDAGAPDPVLLDLIRVYSHRVDFQRDIQPGDRFEVLFEQDHFAESGGYARSGDVLYANLRLSGRDLRIYRFEDADGFLDYYDADGVSIRRLLMRTPIDGARLSSGYGMRRHPILGYTKMHKGMDFAAPTGTPIYAAGDGVVDKIGWLGGYGRYIRVRHNSQIKTAYAHLSRFANGLDRGDRVRQGEVIGYVGSTGRSTGPHLHYEILLNGAQVNPLRVDLPTGKTLEGRDRQQFLAQKETVDRLFRESLPAPQVAAVPSGL